MQWKYETNLDAYYPKNRNKFVKKCDTGYFSTLAIPTMSKGTLNP